MPSENLERQTVADLRERCRELGLAVSGRKAEIIKRLSDKINETDGDGTQERQDEDHSQQLGDTGASIDAEKLVEPNAVQEQDQKDTTKEIANDAAEAEAEASKETQNTEALLGHLAEDLAPEPTDKVAHSPKTLNGDHVQEEESSSVPQDPHAQEIMTVSDGHQLAQAKQEAESLANDSSKKRSLDPPSDPDIDNAGIESSTKRLKESDSVDSGPAVEPETLPVQTLDFQSKPQRLGSATRFITLGNLVRPMTVQKVKDLCANYGQLDESAFPGSQGGSQAVWLDPIKTHAYVAFESIDSSIRLYQAMDGKQFPEDTGKVEGITVDFLTQEQAQEFIKQEAAAGRSARFEVAWTSNGEPQLRPAQRLAHSTPPMALGSRIVQDHSRSAAPRTDISRYDRVPAHQGTARVASLKNEVNAPLSRKAPELQVKGLSDVPNGPANELRSKTKSPEQFREVLPKDQVPEPKAAITLSRVNLPPGPTETAPSSMKRDIDPFAIQWTKTQPSLSWKTVEAATVKRRLERMEDI